jgi:hypothetical protein
LKIKTFFLFAAFLFCFTILSNPQRLSLAQENPCSFSGYLWGKGAKATFQVYVDKEQMELVFKWPRGTTDFRIMATGEKKEDLLIKQPLSEGDKLTLIGPGIYNFEIYSEWGTGCWEATVSRVNSGEKHETDLNQNNP